MSDIKANNDPVSKIKDLTSKLNSSQKQKFYSEIETLITNFKIEEEQEDKSKERDTQSEELFRKAFYINPSPMVITTIKEGRIIKINESFSKLFRCSKNEVTGKSVFELGIYGDIAKRQKFISELNQNSEIHGHQMSIKRNDGKLIHMLLSSIFIWFNNEKHILTNLTDITSQNENEHKIQRSKNLYYTTINSLNDFIFVINREYKILLINETFQKFRENNKLQNSIVGQHVKDIFPYYNKEFIEEYKNVFAHKKEYFREDTFYLYDKLYILETRKIPVIENGEVVLPSACSFHSVLKADMRQYAEQ